MVQGTCLPLHVSVLWSLYVISPAVFSGLQQPLVLPSGAAPGPSHHAMKYQEHPGGDTFSDFVSLVCQEAQNSHSQVGHTIYGTCITNNNWVIMVKNVHSWRIRHESYVDFKKFSFWKKKLKGFITGVLSFLYAKVVCTRYSSFLPFLCQRNFTIEILFIGKFHHPSNEKSHQTAALLLPWDVAPSSTSTTHGGTSRGNFTDIWWTNGHQQWKPCHDN